MNIERIDSETDDKVVETTTNNLRNEIGVSTSPPESDSKTSQKLRVFISHASKDRDDVERILVQLLKKHEIEYFFSPESIIGSDEWQDKIREALSSCTHILIAMTPNSAVSKWVRAEVNWAFEHMNEMQILPVLIKNCEIERLHFLLKNLQFFDFLGNPAKAANSLLASLRIEPKSVSQLLGHDLSESLFGGVIGFTFFGAILAGLIAVPIHFFANFASRLTGWEPAPLKHWLFGGAAIAAVIGGIAGVFYATRDNNRLTVLYLSLLDKLFRGTIIGVVSWTFAWGFGQLGGWSPYPLLLITFICAVGLGVYDLLDTLFMLFEKSLLRRMNTEIFLWNTVGVIFASSVWALSTIAFGNVGTWGTWALCETCVSSILAVVSASVAASTS